MNKSFVSLPYRKQEITLIDQNSRIHEYLSCNFEQVLVVVDGAIISDYKEEINSLVNHTGAQLLSVMSPRNKDLLEAQEAINHYIDAKLGRKACVIIIGGGALGDLYGFAASVYMRGISYSFIPTTPMACLDTIIGKVAVDFGNAKNLIGSFSSPSQTLICGHFTDKWTKNMKAHGAVELFKHMIIDGKTDTFSEVSEFLELEDSASLLERVNYSLGVKARFVEDDHDDTLGLHIALTLGHTIANYLEKFYNTTHGEAVLIGIDHALFIAERRGQLSRNKIKDLSKTIKLLDRVINARKYIPKIDVNQMSEHLITDKINHSNSYRVVGITETGFEVWTYDKSDFVKLSKEWRKLYV